MTAKCKKKGCEKQSSYNVPEENNPILCKEHKLDRMIDVVNRNKNCQHKACRKRASFNVPDERAIFCNDHKKENMVDVHHKMCKNISCNKRATKSYYKGFCQTCFSLQFPDIYYAPLARQKEILITKRIQQKFPKYNFILNQYITVKKKRYRPDMLLELQNRVLIIEIDEDQHKGYKKKDKEKERLLSLYDKYQKQIICIRFNPDGYTNNRVRITSLFKRNDEKKIVVLKPEELEERLKELFKTIKKYLTKNDLAKIPKISTIYLYYDK